MTALFGESIANPFVYIASSYSAVPQPLTDTDRMVCFLIFAVINTTFSPLGEEILYRGATAEMIRTRRHLGHGIRRTSSCHQPRRSAVQYSATMMPSLCM